MKTYAKSDAKSSVTRFALEQTVRRLVKPVLSPSVSIRLQRRWVGLMSKANASARYVRITHERLTGLPVEIVSSASENSFGDRFKSLAKSFSGSTAAATVRHADQHDSEQKLAIIYLHGGAYCIGTAKAYRGLTSRLARLTGGNIYVPDYRLAPEFVFPAAQDDVIKLFRWLLKQGYKSEQIMLAGDSAGGGLALSSCQRIIRESLPCPAGLLLLSPWVDLSLDNAATVDDSNDAMLSWSWTGRCARFYRGRHSATNPGVSPLFGDFDGLPPVCIQAAANEILLPEIKDLASRMDRAGARVTFRVFKDMWHVFQIHAGLLDEADEALDELVAHVRRCKESVHNA